MEQAQTQFEKFFSYGSIGADLKLDLDLFDGIDSFDKEKELQVFNLGGEEQESLRVVLNTTTFFASELEVEKETEATTKTVVSATLILNTIGESDNAKLLVTSFGLTISQYEREETDSEWKLFMETKTSFSISYEAQTITLPDTTNYKKLTA